jgi:DNA polymerase-3 subunit delta
VRLLTEIAGDNLWTLANELEKLSLYAGERRIEEEDVKRLTSYTREANVFAMVDAIVERRASAAMQTLQQLLSDGMAPPYLLVMITRQLRLMVQAKEMVDQKTPISRMTEELGVSPYYPIERLLKQTSGYSMPRLIEVYRKLLDTDIAIKTGKWKGELALELLIAEVCS